MPLYTMSRNELYLYLQSHRLCEGWIIPSGSNQLNEDGYPNGLLVGIRSLHEYDGLLSKKYTFVRLPE